MLLNADNNTQPKKDFGIFKAKVEMSSAGAFTMSVTFQTSFS